MSRRRPSPLSLAALALAALPAAAGAATLVVANKSEATVSLVDADTGAVRATLPTGEGPHEVAVSPDGRTAVVANYGGSSPGSSLTVVDLEARRVTATIELLPHRRPHGLAFLSVGRLLVTAEESGSLLEVDLARRVVARALPTGARVSHMVAASADATRAYVTNIGSGSVTAFDLVEGVRLAEIATGRGAEGIALLPDGSELWVTNREDDTVSVIDTAELRVVATLSAAEFPIRAEATPDGRRVLVSCAASGDLAVFDRASRRLERRVPLPVTAALRGASGIGPGSVPIGLEIAPDGRRAWVAHTRADLVSVVDLEPLAKRGEIEAGREPDGMAFSPLTLP